MAFLDQLNPQLSLADLLNRGGQAPPFRPPGFNPQNPASTSSAGGIVPPIGGMLPPTYQGGGMGSGINDQRLGGLMPPSSTGGAPPFRPPDFNPGGGVGTSVGPQPSVSSSSANSTGGVLGVPPMPKPMPPTPAPSGNSTGGLPPIGSSAGKGAPPLLGPPVRPSNSTQVPPMNLAARRPGNY